MAIMRRVAAVSAMTVAVGSLTIVGSTVASAALALSGSQSQTTPGSTSAQADVAAPAVAASGEVDAWRTARSDTFVDAKQPGSYVTKIYAKAINQQASSGSSLTPISTSLSSTSSGWSAPGSPVSVAFPADPSTGSITVGTADGTVGYQLLGAASVTGSASGSSLTYVNAYPGMSVVETATDTGVKETLVLASASATSTMSERVALPSGDQLVQGPDGSLTIENDSTVVATLPTPSVADADGVTSSAAVAYSVADDVVTVTVDPSWLAASGRAFPVTVDPSTAVGDSSRNATQIESGTLSSTNFGSAGTMCAGRDAANSNDTARFIFQMDDIGDYIPHDAEIEQTQYGFTLTSVSAAMTLDVDPVTTAFTSSAATWTKATSSTNWTAAGGDYTGSRNGISLASAPVALTSGETGIAGGYLNSNIITDWLNGSLPQDGLIMYSDSEGTAGYACADAPYSSGSGPYLQIAWQYHTGLHSDESYLSHSLDTHESVNVNVADGNLVDESTEFSDDSPGVPLSIDRTYNSDQATDPWSNGLGWFNTPQDSGVSFDSSSGSPYGLYDGTVDASSALNGNDTFQPWHPPNYRVVTPTDYDTLTNAAFQAPPGSDSSLYQDTSGNWHLTNNGAQITENDTTAAEIQVASLVSRNGLTETINHNSNRIPPYNYFDVSNILTTSGRTYTFTSPTSGYITGIAGPTVTGAAATAYTYSGGSTYNSAAGDGELLTAKDANGGTTSYGYDSSERLVGIKSPAGREVTFAYNANSQISSMTYVTTTTNCSIGAPTASTCPGDTYTFSYTQPSSTGAACTTTSTVGCGSTAVLDPDGNTTTHYWNSSDEIVKTTDPLGHADMASYDGNGDQTSLVDNTSDTSTATFSTDGLNNPTATQDGAGATTSTTYPTSPTPNSTGVYPGADYEATASSDAQTNCTSFKYDTNGNMTDSYSGQTSPCAGNTGGSHSREALQGDGATSCSGLAGEVCTQTTPRGETTSYAYNSHGDVTTVTPPAPLGATTTTYDAWGRVATSDDPVGNDISVFYNGLNEPTEIRYDGGSSTTCSTSDATAGKCISYTYDADGNLTARLDNTGTTSFSIDPIGRLYQETLPGSVTSTVGYDADGNIISYVDAGGTVSYDYDTAGNLWNLAEPGGSCPTYPTVAADPNSTKCTQFGDDTDNRRTSTTYPSGESITVGYDASDRVNAITAKRPSGTAFFTRTLTYTKSSQDQELVQSQTDNGTATNYAYDAWNRLHTATTGSTVYTYNYDSDGNRTSSSVTGSSTVDYGVNNADELCWSGTNPGSNGTTSCPTTPTGDTGYTYDADGNQKTGGLTFAYNSKNQTTSITNGSTPTTFSYADQGQALRGTSTTSGTTTTEVNGLLGLAGQTVGTGTPIYFTRTPDGQLIALRQGAGASSTNNYYLTDQQGSVLRLTDNTGNTDVATYTYDPYGNSRTATGSLATVNPYRYATGYDDATTGLLKLGDRYYNSTSGFFTQRDPLGQGYAYAGQDPIDNEDPSGLLPCFSCAAIGQIFSKILHPVAQFFTSGCSDSIGEGVIGGGASILSGFRAAIGGTRGLDGFLANIGTVFGVPTLLQGVTGARHDC